MIIFHSVFSVVSVFCLIEVALLWCQYTMILTLVTTSPVRTRGIYAVDISETDLSHAKEQELQEQECTKTKKALLQSCTHCAIWSEILILIQGGIPHN